MRGELDRSGGGRMEAHFRAFAVGIYNTALYVLAPAAWITHVVWIISRLSSDAGATTGQLILGGLGVLLPPVGVIHGLILWST